MHHVGATARSSPVLSELLLIPPKNICVRNQKVYINRHFGNSF